MKLVVFLLVILLAGCANSDAPDTAPEPVSTIAFVDVTESAGLGEFLHHTGEVGDKWYPEPMG